MGYMSLSKANNHYYFWPQWTNRNQLDLTILS